jgi:hypothetical protein
MIALCRKGNQAAIRLLRRESGDRLGEAVQPGGLPRFLFAEFGDVGDVMAAVPGVEEEQPVDGARAVIGMDQDATELIGGERTPEADPAVMQSLEESEGDVDRAGFRIEKLRPAIFVIGLDRGLVFGEGETMADVGVHMAVGDVVDDLADGPAAFAIGSVELGGREITDGGAKPGGSVGDDFDGLVPKRGSDFERLLKLANRVTRVHG